MADLNSWGNRMRWPVRRRGASPDDTVEDIAEHDIEERETASQELPPPAPEPVVMPEPHPRFNLALFRLAALGLALVLALGLVLVRLFVGGPPSLADLRAQSGVDSWTTLPIGVKDDQPGLAYHESDGSWTGFDIDMAYMIAEDLGFRRSEVRFYSIESEDRLRMQATDPVTGARVPVKMVIASYSITQARIDAGVNFSAPYLYTEQSALTLKGHTPVSTFRDLAGKKVCSLSASTSAGTLGSVRLGTVQVDVISKNKVSECFTALRAHQVDAISTDATILAGYMWKYPGEFDHWDLGLDTPENYGVNVGVGTSPQIKALQTLVNVTLYKSWKDPHDDRWENAYQNDLQPEILSSHSPLSKLTPIAVAEQPPVPRPQVRQLPWESVLP